MARCSAALALVFAVQAGVPAVAATTLGDLAPPLAGDVQRLRFHTGGVAGGRPEISPTLPAIPGSPSPWFVTQWRLAEPLTPESMTIDDPATRDPRLGPAAYAFAAPAGGAYVRIYRDRASRQAVYELYERDGALTDAGGANLYLAEDAPGAGVPINQSLEIGLDGKLSKAGVSGAPAALRDGVVSAQVYAAAVVQFRDPQSGRPSTLFLQMPFSGTRAPTAYRACHARGGGRTMIYNASPGADWPLLFAPDGGPAHPLRLSLFDALCQFLAKPTTCVEAGGGRKAWSLPDGVTDLSGWRVKSLYVGLETQARDERSQARDPAPQGSVEAGLQISQIRLLGDSKAPADRAACPAP